VTNRNGRKRTTPSTPPGAGKTKAGKSKSSAGKTAAKTKKPRAPMPPGREARPPRAPRVQVALADPGTGRAIVVASYAGTAALGITAIAADVAPHSFDVAALVVAVALFVAGTGAFIWAYFTAIGRSRTDEISLPGVYGLAGSTPAPVRLRLFGSLATEVVVSVVTAGTRLYSTLSFGVLGVMWGLGLAGLWGARHGAFPPRRVEPPRSRRRSAPDQP